MALIAMMHSGDHDGMANWMAGWMLLWGLVGLALLGLVVAATVWVVRNLTNSHDANAAQQELQMRYARGELSSEEYDERRQRIG